MYLQLICTHCTEEIAGDEFAPNTMEPLHRECHVRLAAGSVAHQRGECFCYGGDHDDDPKLSKREAARAAYEEYYARQREFAA